MAKYADSDGIKYLWQRMLGKFASMTTSARQTAAADKKVAQWNGGGELTVGHVLGMDVPAGSELTDTTYGLAGKASQNNGSVKMQLTTTGGTAGDAGEITVEGADGVSVTSDSSGNIQVKADVKGIASGEKILSLNSKELSTSLSIAIEVPESGTFAGKTTIVLYGKSKGAGQGNEEIDRVDASAFVKDAFLSTVTLETVTDQQAGTSGYPATAGTYIKFVWNIAGSGGGHDTTWLNVSTLLDNVNTTYALSSPTSATDGNAYIQLDGSDSSHDSVAVKGTSADASTSKGAITVTTNANGDIVINTDATKDEPLSTSDIDSAISAAATAGALPALT